MSDAIRFKLAIAGLNDSNYREEATEILHSLALNGHVHSQQLLGYIFLTGTGTPRDLPLARAYYRQAAEGGDAVSQYNLARMLEEGQGGPPDEAEAFRLYRLAAGSGRNDAQVGFALCYINGVGIPHDIRRGVELLSQYGDSGNPEAQFMLGRIYSEGQLCKPDWRKAANWWLNAAERDHHEAQLEIGRCFAFGGRGVKVNYVLAFKFLFLANYAKTRGAAEAFELIRPHLTPSVMEQGKKLLVGWKPKLGDEPAFLMVLDLLE